jgi:hypothetical protein
VRNVKESHTPTTFYKRSEEREEKKPLSYNLFRESEEVKKK